MQNLLGKMAGFVSSLVQGNPPAAPVSVKTSGDDMKQLVVKYRRHFTDVIFRGQDSSEIIKLLTELDCPLGDKYAVLQVYELLKSNSQSLEELKHIVAGLTIIVKYAQHLIRKSEQRREQWRIIYFNNAIVQKKIKPMKGFETLLQQLGYTIATPNGVSYPSGVEPNLLVIVNLIADMILFRKEIKEYLLGRHLHPQYLQQYIPQETQQEVLTAQMSGLKCEDEDLSESSSQISLLVQEAQKGDHSVLPPDQHTYLDKDVTPNDQQVSQQSTVQPECNNNNNPECNNNSIADVKLQTVLPVPSMTADLAVTSDVARESPTIQNIQTDPECETEKLQTMGEIGEAIQDIVVPTNVQDTVTQDSSSGMNSSLRLACTVCGDEAVVYCEDCTNKPLCHGCNINWHKHPQRQKHSQKCISVLAFLSPESTNPVHIDGAYGISTQTNTARISQRQQTHLVNQKALNKKSAEDYKSYSSELPKRFNGSEEDISTMAFYMPQQMKNEQTQQFRKVYNPSNYQGFQGVSPHQEQHRYHQPLQYQQHLPAAGFDPHLVSYQSQVPYNSIRHIYSDQVQNHPHSQVNLGSQFRPDMDSFDPRNSQKQLFDNSDMMNSYHPELGLLQQSTLPYIQQQVSDHQRRTAMLQQQLASGWYLQGNSNRSHNPYPYNQDMVQPQHMGDVGPVSYIPGSVVSNSMFQTMNPQSVHPSSDQLFSLNPQPVIRSNNSQSTTRSNQLIYHQHSLQQGNGDAQMNMQNTYSPNRGHVFHPPAFDVHQMSMSGMFGGNPNSVNAQSPYHILPGTKPTHQVFRQPSVTSSSLSSIMSPFFDELKQVPNVKQKCAKCDEHIARLVKEILNLEEQINCAMEEDIEVCETEHFRNWNKQKALLMQKKKCVEECKKKLEEETAVMKLNSDEETSQEIHYPPDVDLSVKVTKKTQSVPTVISAKVQNIASNAVDDSLLPDLSEHRVTISNKINNAAIINNLTSSLKPKSSGQTEEKRHITAASSSQLGSAHISPPPVPQKPPRKFDSLDITFPPPKVVPVNRNRECQFCTFINEADAHVCMMCGNPLPVITSKDTIIDESHQDSFLDLLDECRYAEQDELEEEENFVEYDDEIHHIGSRICGSQEEVMIEKKRVQQEFKLQQQKEQQAKSGKKSPLAQRPSTPLKSTSTSPAPSPTQSQFDFGEKQKASCSSRPGLESSEHYNPGLTDYHTPPSTASPSPPSPHQSTISQQKKSAKTGVVQDESKDSSNKASMSSCDSTLEDTIARFNEISMIDSMQAQGAEFAKLIKMADKEGFDVEAVEIAQSFCENQSMGPIEWLKKNWKKNVKMVVAMVIAAGNSQQQNSVGEVSEGEAESAYISCHGNMKDAVQLCVKQRTELYEHLSALGDYPREEILQAMFQCCGNRDACERLLNESKLQPYLENIWAEKETEARNRFALDLAGPVPDMCHSFSTSIIFHGDFQKLIRDKSLNMERRIRMIFIEGKLKSWGRAELVIRILDNDLIDEDISLEDVVEAVRNCRDRNSALAYLQQECALCFTNFPMSKIRSLNFCQCKMCEQCLTKNFEIGIREKHVRHWTCPLCSQPDMNDADVASDYLQFLILLLQPLIDKDLQNLFETKVRDWHLQKDVSFRWCAHCAEGFLAENQGGHLRMTCPHCQEKTCFNCKKRWEPQHEGLTCEQFALWKIDNDPNNQSVGLAKHLDENGIDCPTCKMRFALAKGGCMHFKCPQCGHEFCSGCNEPFHQKDVCNKYKICKKLGLHCHCPRDCFSYLRDNTVQQLQQLLKMHNVPFNINTPEDQPDPMHCPVMEQKEFDLGKKDETCGKDTVKGQAGLCEIHYKEYLVYIINRQQLDPVTLMTKEEMVNLLHKYDLNVPKQKPKETPEEYVTHLIKVIQDKLPLRR